MSHARRLQDRRPVGDDLTFAIGYRGRMSIYELVRLTPAMGKLITQRVLKDGYRPMREYGVRKILAGNTTVEEVMSVTVAEVEG